MNTEIDQFAARCNFPAPGQPFRCGVSGGADSLAMMILAVHVGCDVTAIYVDHGLRADSEKDGKFVAAMAKKFGAKFSSLARVEISKPAQGRLGMRLSAMPRLRILLMISPRR